MTKTWVLDTDTKGTGAQMVPLDKVVEKSQSKETSAPPLRRPAAPGRKRTGATPKSDAPATTWSSPLGPGQVRKKATGEIGEVKAVDPGAGTATVLWLRQGRTSTVPLTAISRR